MAGMLISKLRIRTNTSGGDFGVDLNFSSGLNIIHAENTLGKSTCIQAMIYGLGLEGALGPSRNIPLKNALTRKLKGPNDVEYSVIETGVYLEIKNKSGSYLTLHRSSVDEKKDLIGVWFGAGLTEGFDNLKREDYFVRLEGAAVRERGFHRLLAEFIGLNLPVVEKYDGGQCPLYLEALFSVNYVEQTRGWGGIQNVLPTYLGIRDAAQKVVEFTLNLDAQEINRRRQRVTSDVADVERLWLSKLERLQSQISPVAGYLPNFPEKPKKDLLYDDICAVYTYQDGSPVRLSDALVDKRNALISIQNEQNKPVGDNSRELESQLEQKQRLLGDIEESARATYEDFDASDRYVLSIKQRLAGIKDTLKKYSDIKRLERIGSDEEFGFINNLCPTCKQPISDSLLPHLHDHDVLGVDENIKYLESQQSVLESLLVGEETKRQQKEAFLLNVKAKISEYRESIRTIKDTLTSANGAFSKELLRQEIKLEAEISQYEKIIGLSEDVAVELEELARKWSLLRGALEAMPKDGLSATDHKKIKELEKLFKDLLLSFDYKSTNIDDFRISRRNFKPSIDDVELGSEASASDNIRMIWAYLYSLMCLARSRDYVTNHLGLLILDEPRQQEAKGESFESFIKAASNSADYGQQVIIGTSEAFDDLKKMISGLPVHLKHFDHQIIAPLMKERVDSAPKE